MESRNGLPTESFNMILNHATPWFKEATTFSQVQKETSSTTSRPNVAEGIKSEQASEFFNYLRQVNDLNLEALQNHRQKLDKPRLHCGLCKKNGESPQFFTSHSLRDVNGKVSCPVLRKYVCPFCSATGDYSHTRSYCKVAKSLRELKPNDITIQMLCTNMAQVESELKRSGKSRKFSGQKKKVSPQRVSSISSA